MPNYIIMYTHNILTKREICIFKIQNRKLLIIIHFAHEHERFFFAIDQKAKNTPRRLFP